MKPKTKLYLILFILSLITLPSVSALRLYPTGNCNFDYYNQYDKIKEVSNNWIEIEGYTEFSMDIERECGDKITILFWITDAVINYFPPNYLEFYNEENVSFEKILEKDNPRLIIYTKDYLDYVGRDWGTLHFKANYSYKLPLHKEGSTREITTFSGCDSCNDYYKRIIFPLDSEVIDYPEEATLHKRSNKYVLDFTNKEIEDWVIKYDNLTERYSSKIIDKIIWLVIGAFLGAVIGAIIGFFVKLIKESLH